MRASKKIKKEAKSVFIQQWVVFQKVCLEEILKKDQPKF